MAKSTNKEEVPSSNNTKVEATYSPEPQDTPVTGVDNGAFFLNTTSGKLSFKIGDTPYVAPGRGRVYIPEQHLGLVHSDLPLMRIPQKI